MPNFDRTGPDGLGPRTGQATGRCGGNRARNGCGAGHGNGRRGDGAGRGLGLRRRQRGALMAEDQAPADLRQALTLEQELLRARLAEVERALASARAASAEAEDRDAG